MSRNKTNGHKSEWRIIRNADALPEISELTLESMYDNNETNNTCSETQVSTDKKERTFERSSFALQVDALHEMLSCDCVDSPYATYINRILQSSSYANDCMIEARKIAYSACKRMYSNGKGRNPDMLRILMNSMIRDMRTLDIDPSLMIDRNYAIPQDTKEYYPEASARATSDELQTWNPDENKKATTKAKTRKTWDETISDGYDIVSEAYTKLHECACNGMSYESARKLAYRAVHRYVNGERSYDMHSIAMTYTNDEGEEVSKNIAVSYDVYARIEKDDITAIMERLHLTPRETQIVELMIYRNAPPARIADRLKININTVYAHVNAIRKHIEKTRPQALELYRVNHASRFVSAADIAMRDVNAILEWMVSVGANVSSLVKRVPCAHVQSSARYWIDSHNLPMRRVTRVRSYARYTRIK